ncbi:MAG: hypothetical protein GX379_08545 [Clostridiales bacterium]|jgi:YbbR domain-containing protein|nr:hypothetical protein [Clostridiales bacterium]
MKEKLTRNIGLKILSILLAALLWLVITNVNDPVRYDTFTVPVTILNEELVKTKTQSYEIQKGETIEFKVSARRSILESLRESDFEATADFKNLSKFNSVEINVTPKRFENDVTVDTGKDAYLNISIEELSEREIKINVVEKGKVGEGYYIGSKTARPNMIWVDGPKSRVDKIKQVIVEADVEGATRKVTRLLRPKALDEDGEEIDATRLTFSHSYIDVEIDLYRVKEIPLTITATGQPASGYIMTGLEYQPKTIEIAAHDSKLHEINGLEVQIDITDATTDIVDYVDLQDWLDDGVHLVDTDTTASVNISIEKLETRELSIWPNDIELRNKPISLKETFITRGPISISIEGPESEIEDVTRNTLKPYINLMGYSPGTYSLSLETDISKYIVIDDTSKIILSLIYQP